MVDRPVGHDASTCRGLAAHPDLDGIDVEVGAIGSKEVDSK